MEYNLEQLSIQDKPGNRQRIKQIQDADRDIIEACLENEYCQPWFLDEVFRHRYDNDDHLIKKVINHSDCPHHLIALVDNFHPLWLENSSAMAEVQLSMLEPKGKQAWEHLKRKYQIKFIGSLIKRQLFKDDIDSIVDETDGTISGVLGELYSRTPDFIIKAYLQDKDKDNHKSIAQSLPVDLLAANLPFFDPKTRAIVAARRDLSEAVSLLLLKDKSMLVRKALAENKHSSEDILLALAQDKNLKIVDAALRQLPDKQRAQLIQEKLTSGSQSSRETIQLMVLRMRQLNPQVLLTISKEASPLFCCAATLHRSAEKTVIQAAEQRTDLPLWAKIGIALKSDNEVLLTKLIQSNNVHIHIALSDNTSMSRENTLALIKQTKKDRVLANIANHYIDDKEILQIIISHCDQHDLRLKNMAHLLDIKTKATKIQQVRTEFSRYFLVLSRLIIRHPNCPKGSFRSHAYYLPDDAKQNPNYHKLLKKGDEIIVPQADADWKVDEQLDSGYALEFLTHWINTRASSDFTNKRKTITCKNNNPNEVRTLAIVDDSHTHRRFIHKMSKQLSEYEDRMLLYVASPAIKKVIIESYRLSEDVIVKLAHDKNKLVSMAAIKASKNQGFSINVQLDKSNLKNLGNKAARMELAQKSNDLDILKLLLNDKTRDVRAALAERDNLDFDSLVSLLNDTDDEVVKNSLKTIYYRKLEESQREQCQIYFQDIINNKNRGDNIQCWAFNYINDTQFIDAHYQSGKGLFDKTIIEKTANSEFIDQAIFDLIRGDNKFSVYSLSKNTNLNLQQCEHLLAHKADVIELLISNISSIDDLLHLHKKNGSHFYTTDWKISFEHRLECSQSDIQRLHKHLNKEDFINITKKQLHKLDDNVFADLLPTIYHEDCFYNIIDNKNYSDRAKKILLDFIVTKNNSYNLFSYIASFPLEKQWIDKFINHKSEKVCRALIEYQHLSKEQNLKICQNLSVDSLEKLFYYDKIKLQQFPDDLLINIICRNDDDWNYNDNDSIQSGAIVELKIRDSSLPKNCKPCTTTVILKQFEVPLSAVKFNKIMLEKNYLKISKRESAYKSGKYRESKKLTQQALKYGYNSLNYNDDYTINYYPIFFMELLQELGINTEKK